MSILTQKTTLDSIDVAVFGLYSAAIEKCPAKKTAFKKAARCLLDNKVKHYGGYKYDCIGSDGQTIYQVTHNPAIGSLCSCPATVCCYHVLAVRMMVKAHEIADAEPPCLFAEHLDGSNGLATELGDGYWLYVAEGETTGRFVEHAELLLGAEVKDAA